MDHRTQHALVAVFVGALTIATYLPDADRYRVTPFSTAAVQDRAANDGVRSQRNAYWQARPVTVALSRISLLVPFASRAARVTILLTLAAAAVTSMAAVVVIALGRSLSAAVASSLGLAFSAAFAAHATSPASNLAEAAVCLGILGACISMWGRRRWSCMTSAACALAVAALAIAEIAVPLYILAGLAMSVLVRYAAQHSKFAAPAMIFLVPVLNAAEHYGASRKAVDDNALAAAIAEALPGALPARGVVVASDARADKVHGFWNLGIPSPPLIAPLDSVVKRAHEEGRNVFAFGSSRRRLEKEAMHFVTEPLFHTTVPLETYVETLPFRSIVVSGFGPRGAADLAATARFHGSIGIVGAFGLDRPLERNHSLPVDLRVEAGDPIGSTVLAPVPMRVLTDDAGVLIEVNRRYVVQAADGLAMAVVSRRGNVLAAHRLDTTVAPAVPIEPIDIQIGRLDALREPR